jgi:hypothetical protein
MEIAMINQLTRLFCFGLVVAALLAACSSNGIPQAPSTSAHPVNPDQACPQAVVQAHPEFCNPPPSHNPPPSPTPTPHGTPAPTPTPITAADTVQLTHPAASTFNYVVQTSTNTYYFPDHSLATFNQTAQKLIMRGYLGTFIWPADKIVSLLHYGQPVSLPSLRNDTYKPATSQEPGCDPNFDPNCQWCPDCSFDPGNPDNCPYGTDPLVGGCIGAAGIEIRFIYPNYLEYCSVPYALGCFLYGGIPIPFLSPFRAGCTDGYVWFANYSDTRYRCTLPKTAYYGYAVYVDIRGDYGTQTRYFVNPEGDWSIQWVPSMTPLSETSAWIYNLNKSPITFGYAAIAIWNSGKPSP